MYSPRIKDEAYILHFNEYKLLGTHLITFYVNSNNVTCFDSFALDYISE